MNAIITLTVAQIMDLADFAGLVVQPLLPDANGMEHEISIGECPEQGVLDEEDDATGRQYAYIAWCTDYPEEGSVGLGPELPPATEAPAP